MKEFIKVFGNEKLTKAKSPDLQKYLLAKDWSYGYRNLVRVYLSSFLLMLKQLVIWLIIQWIMLFYLNIK